MEVESGKVVKVLRKEYQKWIDELSDEEKYAIRKYTKNSVDYRKPNRFFERLNSMLRGSYDTSSSDYQILKKYASIISKAIKKHPIECNIVCYRGSDYNPAFGCKVGDKISSEAFLSTSVVKKRAFKAKYLLIIHVPKGAKVAYIEKLSFFDYQKELLIDKGAIFKIIDIRNGGKVIEMEVIGYEENN